MPDVLIRGLDAQTLKRLKAKAKMNGRSFQSEAKTILKQAAGSSKAEVLAVAKQWRERLGPSSSDSVELIREDRER